MSPTGYFHEASTFHRARLADSMPGTIRLARKNPLHRRNLSRQKTSKKKAPTRHTRLAVGRELTKGNSIFSFFDDRNHMRLFCFMPVGHRTVPDPESRQAI